MFPQSLVDPRDCSSIVTAFNDMTGGLGAMEIAKMVQKLHDCTNAKQFSPSGANEIWNPIDLPSSLIPKHYYCQSEATLSGGTACHSRGRANFACIVSLNASAISFL
jgi:hypothetical protein